MNEAQQISRDVLRERYARPGEADADAVRRRVADVLAATERDAAYWARAFYEIQQAGFIPAGRICAAAGTGLATTMINCFVQPIEDRIGGREPGRPGIFPALEQAAETMRRGGGVGYDFSRIRPSGALVASTGSVASGPVSYMHVFDRACETIISAGARRGAQMGVLRVDHPDILAFVHAKDERGALANFNVSVAATDAFMQAVEDDTTLELVHAARPGPDRISAGAEQRADGSWVYLRIRARELFDEIMGRAWRYGDPGVIFIDTINRENNLGYAETIHATNPCGEQPLPAHGCCCLGSVDLTKLVESPFTERAGFDFDGLRRLVPVAVRMLDNVLDATYWPLEEQREEARRKRRIGLGITGLGDALAMLGLRYDSDPARAFAARIAEAMRDRAYLASVELAKEKGAFPLFDAQAYCGSPFIRRLPEALREAVREHGVRNSHLLSIAPTGTISLAFADNASNGIEPIFEIRYRRRARLVDGTVHVYDVEDHAARCFRAQFGESAELPETFRTAHEIGVGDHIGMLEAVAPFVDSSISKTVNVPADYAFSEFRGLYLDAWRRGLKGLATFRPNPERESILEAGDSNAGAYGAERVADTPDSCGQQPCS